jgi:PAS domain S-box-containing protein
LFWRLGCLTAYGLVVLVCIWRGLSARWREAAIASTIVLATYASARIFQATTSPVGVYDPFVFSLIFMAGNITLRLRFVSAITSSALAVVITATFVVSQKTMPAEARPFVLGLLLGTAVFTVLAARRIEWSTRHSYLLLLREELYSQAARRLVEHTDAMVGSIDPEGRWLTFNPALAEHLRKRGSEIAAGAQVLRNPDREPQRPAPAFIGRALAGERTMTEQHFAEGCREIWTEWSFSPIPGETPGRTRGVTLLGRDITARKESEAKLQQLNRQVADASRQAGMAEVAIGILHNVGNTLNSVNISAELAIGRLRASRIGSLERVLALLAEHEADLGAFLSTDPKGKNVLPMLLLVGRTLASERLGTLSELESLAARIDHIKVIISAQQQYAKAGTVAEELSLAAVLDDAVRLNEINFTGSVIEIERQFAELPPILIDRHQLLQIVVNLVRNARDALVSAERSDRRLRLSLERRGADRVRVQVIDNGVGIAPESFARLFEHGFTTKKDGHGFGLHLSALMARALGGTLTATSDGPGQGATFTLELPLTPPTRGPHDREAELPARALAALP